MSVEKDRLLYDKDRHRVIPKPTKETYTYFYLYYRGECLVNKSKNLASVLEVIENSKWINYKISIIERAKELILKDKRVEAIKLLKEWFALETEFDQPKYNAHLTEYNQNVKGVKDHFEKEVIKSVKSEYRLTDTDYCNIWGYYSARTEDIAKLEVQFREALPLVEAVVLCRDY